MTLPILTTFKGEAPRISPRALPNEMAQQAVNCRLLSGDLEAWQDISQSLLLGKPGPTYTISLMADQAWLSWASSELNAGATNVDVAKVPVVNDTTYLTVFTGVLGQPQITNLQLATGGSSLPNGPYPIISDNLAVQAPTTAPVVSNTAGTSANITTPYPQSPFTNWTGGHTGPNYGNPTVLNNPANHNPNTSPLNPPVYEIFWQQSNSSWSDSPASFNFANCVSFTLTCACATSTVAQQNGDIFIRFLSSSQIGGLLQLHTDDSNNATWQDQAGVNTQIPLANSGGQFFTGLAYYIVFTAVRNQGTSSSGAQTFICSVQIYNGQNASGTPIVNQGNLSLTMAGEAIELGGTGGSTAGNSAQVFFANVNFNVTTAPPTFIPVYSNYVVDYITPLDLESAPSPASATVQVDNGNSNLVIFPNPQAGQSAAEYFLYRAATGSGGTEYLSVLNGNYADGGFPICTAGGTANAITMTDQLHNFGPVANTTYFFQATQTNTGAVTVSLNGTSALPVVDGQGNALTGGAIGAGNWYTVIFEKSLTISALAPTSSTGTGPSNSGQNVISLTGTTNVVVGQTVSDQQGAVPPGATVTAITPGSSVTISGNLLANVNGGDLITFGSNSNQYTGLPFLQYTDITPTANLGSALTSTNYDPPPGDMQGVLALPNGVIAGFRPSGTLLLSAIGQPQAYPLSYQLATDSPIVGIGAIDANVLILTTSHPYTAYGTDPAGYQMTKEEFVQGCVSKRSIAYLRGYGIVYASTDGVYAYAGQGQIRSLTENLFTLREWEPLNPSSIIGIVHQQLYFFWYTSTAGVKRGYILDPSPNGFGLVELDFHVSAAYVDASDDTLYLVVDSGVIAGGATAANNALCQWEGAATYRPFTWRSKLWQMPSAVAAALARVRAKSYSGLVMTVYANGTAIGTLMPQFDYEFPLPPTRARTLEVQFTTGPTNPDIQTCQLAEVVEDLTA